MVPKSLTLSDLIDQFDPQRLQALQVLYPAWDKFVEKVREEFRQEVFGPLKRNLLSPTHPDRFLNAPQQYEQVQHRFQELNAILDNIEKQFDSYARDVVT